MIDDRWMITHTIYLGERQYDKRWIDRMDRMNVYGLICRNHDKYIEDLLTPSIRDELDSYCC